MRTTSLNLRSLLALFTLLPLTQAKTAFTSNFYHLNSLSLSLIATSPCQPPHSSHRRPPNSSPADANTAATLTFAVRDPDPLTNATTTCSTSFPGSTSPSPTWRACGNSTFGFRILTWSFSAEDTRTGDANLSLTLDVKHSYKDPSVGDRPYDYLTTFAKATLAAPRNLTCLPGPAIAACARTNCTLVMEKDVLLPIYAAVA